MVSSATPTVIRIAVPPNGNCGMLYTAKKIEGKRAMEARNSEPGSVMRTRMLFRYSAVGRPGRMPGMNPPYFRRLSAVSVGVDLIDEGRYAKAARREPCSSAYSMGGDRGRFLTSTCRAC